MDNTVRFGGTRLQLLPGPHRRSWARAVVEVQERLDGTRAVYYHGACLVTTPAPLEAPLLRPLGVHRCAASGSSRTRVTGNRERIIHGNEAINSNRTDSLGAAVARAGEWMHLKADR